MAKQYIGEKAVESVEDTDQTTIGGVAVKQVIYKDGSSERLSEKMLEVASTDKKVDLTELRELRLHPVVQETLSLWLDWGIRVDEVNYLCNLLGQSINENGNAAIVKLWGERGANIAEPSAIDLITIDRVLRVE